MKLVLCEQVRKNQKKWKIKWKIPSVMDTEVEVKSCQEMYCENEFRGIFCCDSIWGVQASDRLCATCPGCLADQNVSIREPSCGYKVSVSLHEEFVSIKLEYGTSAQDNWRESLYGTQLGSSKLLVLAIPVGQECTIMGWSDALKNFSVYIRCAVCKSSGTL